MFERIWVALVVWLMFGLLGCGGAFTVAPAADGAGADDGGVLGALVLEADAGGDPAVDSGVGEEPDAGVRAVDAAVADARSAPNSSSSGAVADGSSVDPPASSSSSGVAASSSGSSSGGSSSGGGAPGGSLSGTGSSSGGTGSSSSGGVSSSSSSGGGAPGTLCCNGGAFPRSCAAYGWTCGSGELTWSCESSQCLVGATCAYGTDQVGIVGACP
jgi:hypothetical protein